MQKQNSGERQEILVWTDGSSHAKGGLPIGWGFVLTLDNYPIDANYGGKTRGTNNEAELTAAIQGLQAVKERMEKFPELKKCQVVLVSDSQYVLGLASGKYTPSKNVSLAKKVRALAKELNVKTRWVKGHSGVIWNDRVDSLAKRGKEMASRQRETESI